MKNQYLRAATGLYVNYFLLGMVNIILSSNMSHLTVQWDTDKTGISYIIAAIGFGKLLTYSSLGVLSDKIGRKPLILFSSIAMGIFLFCIPLLPNYKLALLFALVAGVANAAMDAGSYPALVEIFTKSAGSAIVLVKAFMSLGATLLPFLILFLSNQGQFYGFAFFIPAVIYGFNIFILLKASFPKSFIEKKGSERDAVRIFSSQPKLLKEGIALIIIGFTSTALFTVAQIWLPSYGQEVLNMSVNESVKLLSYYSIGALSSVLLLAFVLNKIVKPVTVLVLYPIISVITVSIILTIHSSTVLTITAFVLGFSTAGVLQLAITIMTELFWQRKGAVTGLVATASSIASVLLPLITGMIAKKGAISHIFIFDGILALLGIMAAIYVNYRYAQLLKK